MSTMNGKAVLVTGGSRGIGAATALRLAQEGADVAFTYVAGEERANEVAARIEAAGRKALPCAPTHRTPGTRRARWSGRRTPSVGSMSWSTTPGSGWSPRWSRWLWRMWTGSSR